MNASGQAGLATRLKGRVSSVGRKMDMVVGVARLSKRVSDLEHDLQEHRELSMRVAQLTDIVQELLIPIADRDEERLHRLLQEYSATL